MINLIPPEGRKIVAREYWTRVATAWLFLISIVFIVGTALMVPSYVLISSQLAAVETESRENLEDELQYKEAETAIKNANTLSNKLNTTNKYVRLTDVVSAVDSETQSGIVLRNFKISESAERTVVEVQGVAATRNDLSSFKSRLETVPLFKSATLPISDLARDEELSFLLTLELVDSAKK
jgi:hypothetical protein